MFEQLLLPLDLAVLAAPWLKESVKLVDPTGTSPRPIRSAPRAAG